MIAVINYGMGNLASVVSAVEKTGFEAVVTNNISDLERADKLILPGVGAFGDAIKNLILLSLVGPLTRMVMEQGKPILGVCLGAQLLAGESYEFGHHKGLGWIKASVVKLETNGTGLRLPHVGWNDLRRIKESILFDGVQEEALFYYTHSFHIKPESRDIVIGTCEYGVEFAAAFQQANIYATQFHPEKSQLCGLKLLKNFLEKA